MEFVYVVKRYDLFNLEFHLQLTLLAENDRLSSTLRNLLGSMQRYFFLGLDLGDFGREMRSEHEHLVELLSARSKEAATACVRDQIASSRQRILRALVNGRLDIPVR